MSGGQPRDELAPPGEAGYEPGYEWVALSVTTVGALLAAVQGSSLIIALPDVLTGLNANFLTIMWVLLGYLLITTALVPVVGRLADMVGRKRLYIAGFTVFTLGSAAVRSGAAAVSRVGPGRVSHHSGRRRRAADHQQHRDCRRCVSAWTRRVSASASTRWLARPGSCWGPSSAGC